MTTSPAEALNRAPLTAFPRIFEALAAPGMASLPGFYRAEFVGPGWLRAIAPPGLGLIHLRGWWGKELAADCSGFNLVIRSGAVQRSLPIQATATRSAIDGRPVVAIRYPPRSPFPWPHVIDELRTDDAHLLGMTFADAGFLRRLPLPFLLHRKERLQGL